jgi:hypothetical protein
LANHRDAELNTPFTERWLQSTYDYHLSVGQEAIAKTPWKMGYRPRIATIPTGDFNARSRRVPGTDEVAVMFDHTLLTYLHGYALVIAADFPDEWWKIPWPASLVEAEVGADRGKAAGYFSDLLVAYVQHGEPGRAARPTFSWRTTAVAATTAQVMRQFLVSHELTHLWRDHLAIPKNSPSHALYQLEYGSDQIGASLAASTSSGDRVVGLWCALLALQAFQVVERGVWFLATGQRQELPASRTHPMPQSRIVRLLEELTRDLWETGRQDEANQLGRRTVEGTERLEQLWLAAEQRFEELHERGAQPAPLWQPRLALVEASEGIRR